MIREWVVQNEVNVMNVAGPRASKDPEIYQAVMELLEELIVVKESLPRSQP
jgi:hypothetical protein